METESGMLLYDDEVFFQVIEGEEQIIAKLYDYIKNDPRHFQPKLA